MFFDLFGQNSMHPCSLRGPTALSLPQTAARSSDSLRGPSWVSDPRVTHLCASMPPTTMKIFGESSPVPD